MSCWALETCLTYVPRQRRRCSREKVDHHQPARFLVGACRRRPPGDPSCSSVRPRLEKRSAQIGVEGPFVHVLAFLQALEKLEVFVVTDDLSVRSAPASEDEAMKVRLRLTLLAYGAIKSR